MYTLIHHDAFFRKLIGRESVFNYGTMMRTLKKACSLSVGVRKWSRFVMYTAVPAGIHSVVLPYVDITKAFGIKEYP